MPDRTEVDRTRRNVVGAMAAVTAAAVGNPVGSAPAQTASRTFLLVHGAWHGGWCWRRVADLLERKGHKVFSPTLTGLCDRSHLLRPDTNLETHVTDVANLIRWERLQDIVLVAHSYAGMVATSLAEKSNASIGSLVFLDAFLPDAGDNVSMIASPGTQKAIADAVARGDTTLKPISSSFFNVNEKDRAWVDSLCTPHPLATFTDKIASADAREKISKKTYIRARGYGSVSFDAALRKASDASWKTFEVPCGHDVMVDMPDRLVEILLEAA